MADGPDIRPAIAAERAAIVDLWGRCGLIRPWNDPVADFDLAFSTGHGSVLVAVVDGALTGAAMVGHDGHRGVIYYLAVDPGQRRGGVGRALVSAAEAWCRERGMPKVNLLVRRENSAVLGFYTALGYRDTGSICLSHNVDADAGEREAALKADWAAGKC